MTTYPDLFDSFWLFAQLAVWGMSLAIVFHSLGWTSGRAVGLIENLMKGRAP